MKIPEPIFKIINTIVKLLLNSPLHSIMSNSVMVITFTGIKSGKVYSTPVRYLKTDNDITFFTSDHGKWWRNLKNGANVQLLIKGKNSQYFAQVLNSETSDIKSALVNFLSYYPQDAVYHNISLNRDKSLNLNELEAALPHVIALKATTITYKQRQHRPAGWTR